MREIKKYKNKKGTKKQRIRLEILNKFQDDLAKSIFDMSLKKENKK